MLKVHSILYLIGLVFAMAIFSSCSLQMQTNNNENATQSQSVSTEKIEIGENDWLGFRGAEAMGVSQATGVPTEWSESDLIWKTPLPGAGSSSPIVVGDMIYLTSYSGYFVPDEPEGNLNQLKRNLIAINRGDGKIRWQKSVDAKLPEEERIRDHGYAANSPVADAERVYAFFGKSGVVAFNHQGEEVWRADVGSKTHGWGTAASPVLYKEMLFVNASVESESLIALDRKTGNEIWRTSGIKESWNTPIIAKTEAGKDELVLAIHGKVLGFDPESGEQLWSCDTDITWYMVPTGVAADGVVYFLGGRSGIAALAVRTGGKGDVTKTHRLWTSTKGSNVVSPVVHEGHLYWIHDKLGIAYCARLEDGEVVYEERLNGAGQVYASTLLANGNMYYLNRSGKTMVVAAKPEFELISSNDLKDGSTFNATPVSEGEHLLLRSDKFLYCIGG